MLGMLGNAGEQIGQISEQQLVLERDRKPANPSRRAWNCSTWNTCQTGLASVPRCFTGSRERGQNGDGIAPEHERNKPAFV
jgi:hypothetical protein